MLSTFLTDKSFVRAELLRKRSDLIYALNSFAKEFGVPEAIIMEGVPEEDSTEVKKFYSQVRKSIRTLEKGTPWSNLAEKQTCLFKEEVCKDLQATDLSMAICCYCTKMRSRKTT